MPALLAVAFAALAVLAAWNEGRPLRWFDSPIEQYATTIRNSGLDAAVDGVSALGGNQIIFGLSAGLLVLALICRLWGWAALVVVATATRPGVEWILKEVVRRPRPQGIDNLEPTTGFSFPSGHVVATVILWCLAAGIARRLTSSPRVRVTVQIVGAMMVSGVTVSRVYLGQHHASVVLGSLLLGLLLVRTIARPLVRPLFAPDVPAGPGHAWESASWRPTDGSVPSSS